jgi:anti-sigma regulatory factor (Ser/Thr protein kinase)
VHQTEDALGVVDVDAAHFDLPNDETAAGQARRDVRLTFTRWRLVAVIEDAALAVSELVTNAFRHGLPPIGLRLQRRAGQVRIDVNDARPEPVTIGERPAELAESGRGLEIVEAVADETGSEHIPGDGKVVYAAWNIVSPAASPRVRPKNYFRATRQKGLQPIKPGVPRRNRSGAVLGEEAESPGDATPRPPS